MLLDEVDLTPVPCSGEVLERLPRALAGRAFAETHACALELTTHPHDTVAAAVAELAVLRGALADELARAGLCAAAAGTHPLAIWNEMKVSDDERYQEIYASMRELARREPTFALHVHVGVPDPESAAHALAGLRRDLPLLLALSANSPYWQGRDTGLAAARIPILSMFPRFGIPPQITGYRDYVAAIEVLTASGAIADPSFIWWDARLKPSLGTVEVRVMDAQTRVRDTAALAALVQCLVRQYAESPSPSRVSPEGLAENRFLAARDGIAARLIRSSPLRLQPASDRLARVLWDCLPLADDLGCRRELEETAGLATRPGFARQRAMGSRRDLRAVLADLVAQYAPAHVTREHRHAPLREADSPLSIG